MLNWSPAPMMYWSDAAPPAGIFGSVRIGATTLPPMGGPEHPVSGPKLARSRTTAPNRRRKFTAVPPFQKSAQNSQSRRYRMMSLARWFHPPYELIAMRPLGWRGERIARYRPEAL